MLSNSSFLQKVPLHAFPILLQSLNIRKTVAFSPTVKNFGGVIELTIWPFMNNSQRTYLLLSWKRRSLGLIILRYML